MTKVCFPGIVDTTEVAECAAFGPLAEHVDALERGLATALKDYRHHAEEALGRHLDALERADAAHRLEVSTLRAENYMLRDKLGLVKPAESNLFQSVKLQAAGGDAKEGRLARASTTTDAIKRSNTTKITDMDSDNDATKMLNVRKAKTLKPDKSASMPASGGTWQSFVAWVPVGAALKSPEPWKPLPPSELPVDQDKANIRIPPSPDNMSSILPGSPSTATADTDEMETNSSGSSEKEHFEVLEGWQVSKKQLAKMRGSANGDCETKSRYSGESLKQSQESDDHVFACESPKFYIIHPHSTARIAWDFSSLFMLIYDMVMIPMQFFSLPNTFFLAFMDWTTRLFWTLDMGWSSCTGIVLANGTVQFELRYILKQYARTWLGLDVLIIGSDWMEVIFSAQGGKMGLGRLARAFRIVRALRLLRLARMKEIMTAISERIQSDKLVFLMSILKMQIFVMSISHVTACCWWGIGAPSQGSWTWAAASDYGDKSITSQYLVSLHWALCQLTGGMDEVVPVNAVERFYSVVVWMIAFMAASIIVSVLTSNLTQLHIIGGSTSRQMSTLRKYLKQNRISSNLALRVQRSAQHAVSGDLTQDAVELLAVVSEPLRIEMHFELYSCILRYHPFFADYTAEKPQAIRRVCHYAMSMLHLAEGDVVFGKGEVPTEPKMYFVVKGALEYLGGWYEAVPVLERQWISEAALWTRWQHRGTLAATGDAKIAVLDASSFQEIVVRFKASGGVDLKLYAADFVDFMNTADEVSDLTSMCSRV